MEAINKLYSPGKSATKAVLPVLIPVVVELLIGIAKTYGVEIDKTIAYSVASLGFGAIVGFINWLKNHKK